MRTATRHGYRWLVGSGLVMALAAGCGGAPEIPTLTAAHVTREQPPADAPVAEVARAVTALGYRLDTSALPADRNSVLSPLSIAYAFAMARAGAAGQTAAQLDQVLGFPAGVHGAFNAITHQVVTADTPPQAKPSKDSALVPPVVCVGNALFPQRGLPIGQPFLTTLAAQYGTGVHPVDFASGKAGDVINQWVDQQTAGRITRLFDSLPADTKLVLANTVYLRASWDHLMFVQGGVQQKPFTRPDGSTVPVPMMHANETLRFATGDGWQAVDVPFADSQLVMRLLLPAAGHSPASLLAPDTMAAVAAALQPAHVGLSVPRWDFASNLDLVPALKALGLTSPFSSGADFSGISRGLYVDQAVHRATITVDEWGTEAAAVTGLSFAMSATAPPKTELVLDRPFAFAIVHTGSGVPLFMGQVADPSAH